MVSAVTPAQYGDEYIASESEMKKHASNATASTLPIKVDKEELQWMSQWSPDEELAVDYSSELGGSWMKYFVIALGFLLVAGGLSKGAVKFSGDKKGTSYAAS